MNPHYEPAPNDSSHRSAIETLFSCWLLNLVRYKYLGPKDNLEWFRNLTKKYTKDYHLQPPSQLLQCGTDDNSHCPLSSETDSFQNSTCRLQSCTRAIWLRSLPPSPPPKPILCFCWNLRGLHIAYSRLCSTWKGFNFGLHLRKHDIELYFDGYSFLQWDRYTWVCGNQQNLLYGRIRSPVSHASGWINDCWRLM